MRSVITGVLAGVVVFFGLRVVFASGTGPVELALWLAIAVVSGLLARRLTRPGGPEQP